jgi:hypothetical protein
VAELLRRTALFFDPRERREPDIQSIKFDNLGSANRALMILWRWYERKAWSVRLWRCIWLMTLLVGIWGWAR